jgi:ABC-type multidrug transport system permease subunit
LPGRSLGRARAEDKPQFVNNALEIVPDICYDRFQFMERTRGELILFAVAASGIWLSIWAVILLNTWLGVASLLLALGALCGFALRDES